MSHYYDDPEYSYLDYWRARKYEHRAEISALKYLLKKRTFHNAADVGGGFGRLTKFLTKYAEKVYLVEPSTQLRLQAEHFLKETAVHIIDGTAESLPFPSESLDLLVQVRVSHHLKNLKVALAEHARVLEKDGILILEIANSTHIKERIKKYLSREPMSQEPRILHDPEEVKKGGIPFVNHHPLRVEQILREVGFEIEEKLSVSNFRSPLLKKFLPTSFLQMLEYPFQRLTASLNFGPSIFYRARKVTSEK